MTACHLFVYGTLRRAPSHAMHQLLLPATFVGRGTFQGALYDLGSYPAAVASDDPAARVRGGSADDPAPQEYRRVVAAITLEAGGKVSAYLYLFNRPVAGLTRIASGDYLCPGPPTDA